MIIAQDISTTLIEAGLSISGIAYDYNDAIEILENTKSHLAILDINLESEKSGLDIAEVLQRSYKIPFIFLTSYSDEDTLSAAQESSPFGYLVKPFQEATLITTLKIAWSNYLKLQKDINLKLDKFELTERERDICKQLCTGKSYNEIAECEFISLNTVRYHVKNLHVKIDVKSRAELIAKLV